MAVHGKKINQKYYGKREEKDLYNIIIIFPF